MRRERQGGPTLLVDGGDALSRMSALPAEKVSAEKERSKAELILEQMGKLEYQALAVGERDLVLGLEPLKKLAREAKLTLLGANLTARDGTRPFDGHKLVTLEGAKVGIFAVAGPMPEYEVAGFTVSSAEEAAQAQAQALKKEGATFIVALLHMGYDQSLKLSANLKDVDFVIQSHDGRVSSIQLTGNTLLTGGGERGRLIGRAVFRLSGALPYVDLSEANNVREQLASLDRNLAEVKERMKNEPKQAASYNAMVENFRHRREELVARMNAKLPEGRRTVMADQVAMDDQVSNDARTKRVVDAYIEKYGSTVVQH